MKTCKELGLKISEQCRYCYEYRPCCDIVWFRRRMDEFEGGAKEYLMYFYGKAKGVPSNNFHFIEALKTYDFDAVKFLNTILLLK
jgi:hypothetical protein